MEAEYIVPGRMSIAGHHRRGLPLLVMLCFLLAAGVNCSGRLMFESDMELALFDTINGLAGRPDVFERSVSDSGIPIFYWQYRRCGAELRFGCYETYCFGGIKRIGVERTSCAKLKAATKCLFGVPVEENEGQWVYDCGMDIFFQEHLHPHLPPRCAVGIRFSQDEQPN